MGVPADEDMGEETETEGTEEVMPRPRETRSAKGKKNVARRGAGFTKEEDRVICSAFLNVSKDPITGTVMRKNMYHSHGSSGKCMTT